MVKRFLSPAIIFSRLRRSFKDIETGGDWALELPQASRQNLRWFWYDGLFASASDNIVITYMTLYVVALGATGAQIGIMSALSSLSATLLLLPGAMLVERFDHRREFTLLFGGTIARFALLFIAIAPFGLSGTTLIITAMALSITRDAFGNLAFPAWLSMTADIVPIEGRGRYFGSRNFIMGVAGMITILLVGELITRFSKPEGYQLGMALAFILGLASTYSFSHLREPSAQIPIQKPPRLNLKKLYHDLRQIPALPALIGTAFVWNFFLNIPGPSLNVYLAVDLKATATMVGITSVTSTICGLLVQRRLGRLADRWGARRLQMISGLLIPILPLAWVFVRAPWQVIPINIIGGVLWGAYNLVFFNLLLELTPQEGRARYSAMYQVFVTLALAAGAMVGGWMVTQWGYQSIFLTSAIGRLFAAFLFARLVYKPSLALNHI